MDFTIEGIGTVPSNRAEYTSGAVLKKYLDNIAILAGIYNHREGVPGAPSTTLSSGEFNQLMDALNRLKDLALNGSTDGNPPLTFYLTAEMAINLDMVLKSLKAVGIMPGLASDYPENIKVQLLSEWQSLAGFGVQAIMNAAANVSSSSTRTLQSMVELEYVKQGNELLATKFNNLEESLRVTQGVLDSLAIVQGIANQITVTNRGDFAFPPQNTAQIPASSIATLQAIFDNIRGGNTSGDPNNVYYKMANFTNKYNSDVAAAQQAAIDHNTSFSTELARMTNASDAFNSVLQNNWGSAGGGKSNSTTSNTIQYYTQIYKAVASAQFSQVFPTATPTSTAASELLAAKQQLYQKLINLERIAPANTRSTEGTLANFIYKVVSDISTAFLNVNPNNSTALKDAVSKWILDNQNQKISSAAANSAGSIQDRVTQAIKAAESLNDQQKEDVRNFQFVFEQFYKSATAVLQKVTQIIEKVAQGINR